jgi:hypothetical protein
MAASSAECVAAITAPAAAMLSATINAAIALRLNFDISDFPLPYWPRASR